MRMSACQLDALRGFESIFMAMCVVHGCCSGNRMNVTGNVGRRAGNTDILMRVSVAQGRDAAVIVRMHFIRQKNHLFSGYTEERAIVTDIKLSKHNSCYCKPSSNKKRSAQNSLLSNLLLLTSYSLLLTSYLLLILSALNAFSIAIIETPTSAKTASHMSATPTPASSSTSSFTPSANRMFSFTIRMVFLES